MWSDGPSATDSLRLSTVTVLSCTAPSTDTGYTAKEVHVRKVRKKIEKKRDQNKMKKNVMKRKERRQLGVVSGMEADESDVVTADRGADGNGDGDGDGESGDGESCL